MPCQRVATGLLLGPAYAEKSMAMVLERLIGHLLAVAASQGRQGTYSYRSSRLAGRRSDCRAEFRAY